VNLSPAKQKLNTLFANLSFFEWSFFCQSINALNSTICYLSKKAFTLVWVNNKVEKEKDFEKKRAM